MKVLQLELALRALERRGIEEDLVEMEVRGIPQTLKRHGLSWESLGLRGSTLYYRRRIEDMPLVEIPENAGERVLEKIGKSRQRVLEKAVEKYLFRVEPLHAPIGLLLDADRLAGLSFARTRVQDGRLLATDQVVEVRSPMVISSIGSVPEPLRGIPMRGELYDFTDPELGRLEAYPNLFSTGNVVTGKGNIVDSRRHAKDVAMHVRDQYFALAAAVKSRPALDAAQREALLGRVRGRQSAVGYNGDYKKWIAAHKPPEFT
jgi:hypothetical protein